MTTTETQLERTVREEQEAHDHAEVEPRRQNVETRNGFGSRTFTRGSLSSRS